MTEDQLIILKQKLADDFVPHMPPLLDQNKPAEHLLAKNVSRAYAGFAIQKISKLDEVTAAKAVVDAGGGASIGFSPNRSIRP